MKLSSITIKNYRAIEDITIKLNHEKECNFNVIYGVNGVGKSSVLYALHDFLVALSTDNKQIFFPDRIRDLNLLTEIKVIAEQEEISANLILNEEDRKSKNLNGKICREQTVFSKTNQAIKFSSFIPNVVPTKAEAIQDGDKLEFKIVGHPKFAYSRGIVDYAYFKSKFEEFENLENQKKLENKNYFHPALQIIRNSIKFLSADLASLTIDRERKNNPLCIKKDGKLLTVDDQLSSGEASIIALIGQIAIDNYIQDDEERVVIIDEVDMSLHPQWQMEICKVLKKAFPKNQFIVSSHSPFIWAGLNKEEVIWLDFDENHKVIQKDVDFAKGGSIESIIANFFNTDDYDKDFSEELHKIEDAIDRRDPTIYEQLKNLERKYGKLPVVDQLLFKMELLDL